MTDHLEELLQIIKGKRGIGSGIYTYPGEPDDDQRKLHEGCLELERQGKIYRAAGLKLGDASLEEKGWIFWKESKRSSL